MPGVRVDGGIVEGGEIAVHYDPLVAKLIARGDTREAARRRALAALRSYPILSVRTNGPFLIALLEHPRFVAGQLDTGLVDAERPTLLAGLTGAPPPEAVAVALQASADVAATDPGRLSAEDSWTSLRGWRG